MNRLEREKATDFLEYERAAEPGPSRPAKLKTAIFWLLSLLVLALLACLVPKVAKDIISLHRPANSTLQASIRLKVLSADGKPIPSARVKWRGKELALPTEISLGIVDLDKVLGRSPFAAADTLYAMKESDAGQNELYLLGDPVEFVGADMSFYGYGVSVIDMRNDTPSRQAFLIDLSVSSDPPR